MTQAEIIKALAEKTDLSSAKIKEVLQAQADLAQSRLKTEDEFVLIGFGKLKAKTSAERDGRNPSTGEALKIKAGRQARLALGKTFKDGLQ